MKYDKKAVKLFIKNYHKHSDSQDIDQVEDIEDIDDFFSISDSVVYDMEDSTHIDEIAFFNELEAVIEQVGTMKQQCIFYLMCEGRRLNDIGKIFNVSGKRVRQLYDDLLNKICE
ncbi:RNA polymerase subunit sigma-70 [Macrococcus bovicus]|uniref:RNA polymerase subunit sigma-70 n=1 Tax=Macrococcus bovicus TaxID=69968 RepID=UPI0025A674A1|nr:RNA polymerase subunit sigma-70 [Macrococcus bovicus]WJP97783.1 RNA polymerase subunit sigma-70 [Macrococcus bovicus]